MTLLSLLGRWVRAALRRFLPRRPAVTLRPRNPGDGGPDIDRGGGPPVRPRRPRPRAGAAAVPDDVTLAPECVR